METNQAEEGREGYRDRNKGGKDMYIQQGFLEEVLRGKKMHTSKVVFQRTNKVQLNRSIGKRSP